MCLETFKCVIREKKMSNIITNDIDIYYDE